MTEEHSDTRQRPHQFTHGDQVRTEDLDWPTVYGLTSHIVTSVQQRNFWPDCIVAIYDPESSGGYAVSSQLAAFLSAGDKHPEPPVEMIRVEGRVGSRVVSETPSISASAKKVLIIDDVSWSGNTMRLAKDALAKCTNAEIKAGALLVGDPSVRDGSVDFWGRKSEARDVRFPGGVVTPTTEFAQFFDLTSQNDQHPVSWAPRPWGFWEQFALNELCTVRILTIFPNQCLSLQYHEHREEFFVALDDGIMLQVGEKTIVANRGDYVLIPRYERHRQFAPPSHAVRVLEVSFGNYDQVGDIVGLDDKYGRVDKDGSV